ncbi:hypothetical protein OQA88_414 [Cercophora sp. LCS_1]
MSSVGAGAEPAAAPQVCSQCRKSFPRLCDLNKHAKSHSRPFKCTVTSCKYHEHGWPTAKELERHVNDKHSRTPRTFKCIYQPCTYESKRESNCKQHMEKKHGWVYHRSKSNGKQVPSQHPSGLSLARPLSHLQTNLPPQAGTGVHPTPVSAKPVVPAFEADFVLYPDDNEQPIILGQAGDELSRNYEDAPGDESRVFIPWNSPATRLMKNQSVLEMFTETYNRAPEKSMAHSDAMIDPSLQHYTHTPSQGWQKLDGDNLACMSTPVKVEPPSLGLDTFSWSRGSDTGSAPEDSPSGGGNPSTAYSSQFPTPHSVSLDFTGAAAQPGQMGWMQQRPRRRGSDGESDRPEKRFKSSPVEDFTDSNMPDIFRRAHPHIYDRDQKEKYSPCHSSHRDISTLVRHLGRPAHRLCVTKETISSFEIEDDDYPHPRIGICRRCWSQFSDRQAFSEHIANPCSKVSKGKREKWQVLYDSFTPLVTPSTGATIQSQPPSRLDAREQPPRSPSRQSDFFAAAGEEARWDVPSSPFPRQSVAPLSVPDSSLVSLHEYERLQKEHDELRQKHQQLEKIANKLLIDRAYQEAGATVATGASSDGSPFLSTEPKPLRRPAVSILTSRVPQLNGDSLERDIQGLMNESEGLSRQDSDLSFTRSVHVTNSPPPLPLANDFTADNKSKGKAPTVRTATPRRKLLESIPDSGYQSMGNQRNGSFGEATGMPDGAELQSRLQGHRRHPSSQSTAQWDSATSAVHQFEQRRENIAWKADIFGPPAGSSFEATTQHNTFMPGMATQMSSSQSAGEQAMDDIFNDYFTFER